MAQLILAAGVAIAVSSSTSSPQCQTIKGFSWPESKPIPSHPHMPTVVTLNGCCGACANTTGCVTFTLHPSNGCWLHGAIGGSAPKWCGDGDACTTGTPLPTPLPPTPPPPGPPAPPGPLPPTPPKSLPSTLARPTKAHLRFHEDNLGAIMHFNMQTFHDHDSRSCQNGKTWAANQFSPRNISTDQWVQTAASFGAKYFVLVVDHFSGFSLYPTKAHNYSVQYSPWKNGEGDIIADFVASCKKFNVRPGFFYSVHANWHYGVCDFNLTDPTAQTAFEDMAITQLTELGEKYGDDLAEIWFDAGVRQSDAFVSRVNSLIAKTYPSTATCHSCQNMPNVSAVSWMGNENTVMPYPVWNANDEIASFNGMGGHGYGIPNGNRWVPAHCDAVLRRHYWFWAQEGWSSDADLNNASKLLQMHLTSIGRGCNMVLDMSPDTTGLLQEVDVNTYAGMGDGITRLYGYPVAEVNGTVNSVVYSVSLPRGRSPIARGAIELREDLTKGQSISNYSIATLNLNGTWSPMPLRNGPQLTIGNRRIHTWDTSDVETVTALRVSISTLMLANQTYAPSSIRSIKLFDWSSAELDDLVTDIFKID